MLANLLIIMKSVINGLPYQQVKFVCTCMLQIKAVDVTHTHDGHLPQTVNYSSSANVVTRDDDVPLLESSTVMEPVYTHSKFSLPIGLPSCRNILAQFIKNLTIYKRKIG